MDLKRYHKIMESMWLFIGCLTTVIVIYIISATSFKDSYIYLLLPAMAFLMFYLRRLLRKKMEKENIKH